MKSNKIAIIGAFDRFNYGDVLMPAVFTQIVSKISSTEYQYDYYGLKRADLTKQGGYKCSPISEYYQSQDEYYATVVVGGEVLGAEYWGMLPMLMEGAPFWAIRPFTRALSLFAKISNKSINKLIENEVGSPAAMPWIIQGAPTKVIYNTVGGSRRLIPYIRSARPDLFSVLDDLRRATYISVRSTEDMRALSSAGIKARLAPDSVSLISRVLNAEDIARGAAKNVTSLIAHIGNYFAFQINYDDAKQIGFKYIASCIETACSASGLSCLLVPIGLAPLHDDDKALGMIAKYTESNVHILPTCDVASITYALSNAECYVGTSLHGCIVSGSFGVPHTSIERKEKKTSGYLETWKSSPMCSIKLAELDSALSTLTQPASKQATKRSATKIQSAALNNFAEIIRALEG